MPRDAELFLRFRELANSGTRLMTELVNAGADIPTTTRRGFVRRSPDSFGTVYRQEPIWRALVREYEPAIKGMPVYENLAEYVGQSRLLQDFVERSFPSAERPMSPLFVLHLFHRAIVEDFLCEAVSLAITSNQPVAPDEELAGLYEGAEAEIYDEPIVVRAFAPVYRLMRAVEFVELSPSHRIRTIGDQDRDTWLRAGDLHGAAGGELAMPLADFAVEVDQTVRSGTRHTLSDEVDRVLTVLRLFKTGGLAIPSIAYGRVNNWRKQERWEIAPFATMQAQKTGPGIGLDPLECDRLKLFWSWFCDKRNQYDDSRISIALRRFSRACSDDPPEDRLIDSCVAFDALLNPQDRLELSYRVGLRAAFLVGRDPDEREVISQLVKDTYKVRGQVVHGGKEFTSQAAAKSLSDLLGKVVPFLAKLIRAWLSLPAESRRGKAIEENLEKNVLSGGDFLKRYISEWVHDL